MNTCSRQGLHPGNTAQTALKDSRRGANFIAPETSKSRDVSQNARKIRVWVDAGNFPWDEDLMRMLANHAGLETLGGDVNETFRDEKIVVQRLCERISGTGH
jgi:hypothetical protein